MPTRDAIGLVQRWAVVGVGSALLFVSLLYSLSDNESVLVDSAEVVLPVICALAVVGFGYRVASSPLSDRQAATVALGHVAGGLAFLLLVGWILYIQGLDGDVPPEPYYTLLNGSAIGVVGNGVLTAWYLRLREQRRTARRQNERLERFARVVSHDLRNPLNVAIGRVALAEQTGETGQLAHAEKALERMNELIEDLLRLTRYDEELELEDVHLNTVVERCWRNVETGGCTVRADADVVDRADVPTLERLFENLFRNAVEHGAEGDDSLTVTVGALDDGFYVEDDGRGIPKEEREAVFDSGYTTGSDGTGLGLDIVTRAARRHGWQVDLTEERDGGARFEVRGVERVSSER